MTALLTPIGPILRHQMKAQLWDLKNIHNFIALINIKSVSKKHIESPYKWFADANKREVL